MEPRLTQSQTQKLILSPQIRQYLRLLQLPLLQLQTAIEQELAENPALEEISKESLDETPPETPEEAAGKTDTEELRFDETLHSLDKLDENFRESLSPEGDLSFPDAEEVQKRAQYRESLITPRQSLSDYLLWQVGFLDFTVGELKIAEEIVGNLTEEGYLGIPPEEIAQVCGASVSEVEKVLRGIQTLDPPGISARNLQETLLLQLERKGPEAELAQRMVRDCFPLLEKKQWDQTAKRLNVSPQDIQQAARFIAHLDPKPGRTFYAEDSIAVRPDASISLDKEDKGKWVTEIYDDEVPSMRVSPYYRKLLKNPKLDEASRNFIKGKLRSAIDFLRALSQRQSTLRAVTEEIVKAQPEFFHKGFSDLKPLRLKDIAASLGIHESTVSRAIQEKYLSTPHGTIPYKSFFSSRLERVEGEAESQKSMMEKIREMIRSEDPRHPLSDQAITHELRREGIQIARRTVAKYRELLRILPSHLRKER